MDPMPLRLAEVDALARADHHHLPADLRCFYWGEYTPYEQTKGQRWSFSATNQLLSDFKKKMDRQGQPDWPFKAQATQQIAEAFARFWNWPQLHTQKRVTLIPLPPSKARTDPAYDPRMLDVLNGIAMQVGLPLDIRDCLSFSGKFAASHVSSERPSPDDLHAELGFDTAAGKPNEPPGTIFLFDDMLTSGAHIVAIERKLAQHFPGVPLVVNVIARRIAPDMYAGLVDPNVV